jgi:SPP1 gp7 family putative phage head morphogenesis protein
MLDYYRDIYPLLVQIKKRFDNVVMEKAALDRVQKEITDQTALVTLEDAFQDFEEKINTSISDKRIKNIARNITKKAVKRNKRLWKDKLNPLGIDISKKESFKGERDYVTSRVNTNTTQIKNLKDTYIEQLNTILFNAYEQGTPLRQLTKDIEKQFDVSKNKAKLIARNETKNTNTQMNKKQALELGFDQAVWLTSDDVRVRHQHDKHKNKTYTIGVGLDDGKGGKEEPGDAINCRCSFYLKI